MKIWADKIIILYKQYFHGSRIQSIRMLRNALLLISNLFDEVLSL